MKHLITKQIRTKSGQLCQESDHSFHTRGGHSSERKKEKNLGTKFNNKNKSETFLSKTKTNTIRKKNKKEPTEEEKNLSGEKKRETGIKLQISQLRKGFHSDSVRKQGLQGWREG